MNEGKSFCNFPPRRPAVVDPGLLPGKNTWPLLRRAPIGRHGSPHRVLTKILRLGVSVNSLPIELKVMSPFTGPLTSVRANVALVARQRGRSFAAPPMGATAIPTGVSINSLPIELRVSLPCTGPLNPVRAFVVLVARPRGRCFAAPWGSDPRLACCSHSS